MSQKRILNACLASVMALGFAACGNKSGNPPAADNTATNARDRMATEHTADQAKSNSSDVQMMAQIRRSIMDDGSLSTDAHNVKIIAENGVVTLKGPVKTDAEKAVVEKKAADVAGSTNVKSELAIVQ